MFLRIQLNNSFVSNVYVGDDGKLHKVQGGADSVLPFSSIKYFRTTEFLSSSSVKEYEVGFRPKFLMFIVANDSCSYDEVINKQFYNGGYDSAVSLGTWVGNNSFNITEITDTGFKAQVWSGYNNKPMMVFAAG